MRRTLNVDGTSREIIGVLPRDFQFLDNYNAALFLPMQLDRSKVKLGNFSFRGLARLKPGVTLKQANADMDRLLPIAIHSFPAPDGYSTAIFEKVKISANLHPLKKDVVGDVGNVLWVLMGSIVVVLLVACANVANLLLVRVEGRRQELAIRSALGAGRTNITMGLLFESRGSGSHRRRNRARRLPLRRFACWWPLLPPDCRGCTRSASIFRCCFLPPGLRSLSAL